ncbi:ParA family protein [Iodobacter fluviatilis]|uniref:AAA domain-containing protein n=2 Tax=Iodobacter fluviatilis TaxID=537 RepID=A0A7G3GFE7_9NEIS|nr:ParA family protein [Iodobacter fluviatilis]QBC45914.1 hypothetical protein C1H71_20445 [Iodobacter fluviatilis]
MQQLAVFIAILVGKMDVVAVFNQKGGVGKSTTTVQLADGCSRRGMTVLVIDLDPQSNSSTTLSPTNPKKLNYTAVTLIQRPDIRIDECIYDSIFPGVFILPMVMKMRELEIELWRKDTDLIAMQLAKIKEGTYDIILIDCPPNLGKLTLMALTAATHYLVPVKAGDQYALDGIEDLEATVLEVKRAKNPKLKFIGALLTMFDGRKGVDKVTETRVIETFPGMVFDERLPESVKVKEAIMRRVSVFSEPNTAVAKSVARLSKEFLTKLGYEGFADELETAGNDVE